MNPLILENTVGNYTHDTSHARDDLRQHAWGDALRIIRRVRSESESINNCLTPCDVAARRAERFRKGTHKNINLSRVHAKVIRDSATMRTKRTDRVGFINEDVKLLKHIFTHCVSLDKIL
jgi:hypothetical protein